MNEDNLKFSICICSEKVNTKEGTGIIHISPGHGEEDYKIWMAYLKELENERR